MKSLIVRNKQGQVVQSWPWKPGQHVNEHVKQESLAAVTHAGLTIEECDFDTAMSAFRDTAPEEELRLEI